MPCIFFGPDICGMRGAYSVNAQIHFSWTVIVAGHTLVLTVTNIVYINMHIYVTKNS